MRDRILTGLTIVVLLGCEAASDMPAGGLASGGSAAGEATPGSPTGGADGSPQQPAGGTVGAGGTTAPTGNTTQPSGESTCVQGVQTGDACDPSVDTASCARSTRTCECGADSRWTCASTDGRTSTGGSSGTAATGGASNPGNTGQTTGGTTATGGAGTSDACADKGTTHSGGTQYCSSSTGNVSGTNYHYEYWTAGSGSACMTVFGDEATFKCNWSNAGDFLARVGLRYNETQTPDQIGTFSSDFAITGSGSGLIYIGVYGWTNNPLIEYYIIEDWVNSQWNSAPSIGTNKGTITVDGGEYTVYQNTRTGASIHGDTTFTQYYSIRTTGRPCGHISISEHFSKWASMGMQMGQLYEVKLLVEGMNGASGDYEFTRATVVVQ